LLKITFTSFIHENVLAESLKVDARVPLNIVSVPNSNVSEDERKLNCGLLTKDSSLLQLKGSETYHTDDTDHLRFEPIQIQTNYHYTSIRVYCPAMHLILKKRCGDRVMTTTLVVEDIPLPKRTCKQYSSF
jgi:hypothetical protein